MSSSLTMSKPELVALAQRRLDQQADDSAWTTRQKLALACRILYDGGHDSGLAGQITCRAPQPDSFYTQQLGLGFDEISSSNLIEVDQDLQLVAGRGIPNPANRFHTWIYRERPDVNCIIHTHPAHIAALSMLEVPLQISHMDTCPLYDDCAFLQTWPGIPVGNEEGELIAAALGGKRAILLAHHGQLIAARSIEEACMLALLIERAARLQLLAMAAGSIAPMPPTLAHEAREWISTDKRHAVTFAYYARRALRQHSDCLI